MRLNNYPLVLFAEFTSNFVCLLFFSIMAAQIYFVMATSILGFSSSFTISATDFQSSGKDAIPKFAFSWLDDKDTFQAGDIATIRIKVLENIGNVDKDEFNPVLTVNGRTGNSSYVSGVLSDFGVDPSNWSISFTPILVGMFNVMINEDVLGVFDSSLQFQVVPGQIHPSVCVASWTSLINEFEAGTKASILMRPKDAFGNNISSTEALNVYNYTLSIFHTNNSIASLPNITNVGWNKFGYINIEFLVVMAGNFLLHLESGNQTLIGTPLPFKVNPGPLEVSNCVVKWDFEPNAWQLFSKMEIFIHQRDKFDNLVPGLYAFDAEVVEKETNLSIPVSDLRFEEVEGGIQLFSFSNLEPGTFLLTIFDSEHNKSISNMPYAYTVYVGYCDGFKSVVNGTGFNTSIAGETSEFSVYLNDMYEYPSPVEVQRLQVIIVREVDSYYVLASIHPMQIINGSEPIGAQKHGVGSREESTLAPASAPSDMSVADPKMLASAFDVIYTPDKSGVYKIFVFTGNILLNGAHSFTKEVVAAEVNVSLSRVVRFGSKVAKLTENEIAVHLMDSFLNPVLSQQSRLALQIASVNSSGFSSLMFVDNNNGSYTGHYVAKDVGTYEVCASFDGNHLSPCPFLINVYSGEYFPKAINDTVSVWEDESIAFDVLENDYFAGDNTSIVSFTNPCHGSLVQYGRLLRYTPYKDYYGNDSFMYTISDINGNLATASVNIFVLSIPPQFASFPSELHATENILSPRFGGFLGFEIRYSDANENISVNLRAQSGSIFLSPMLMQFDQSLWSRFSVNKGDGDAKDLILEGCLDVINVALQSIQYLGNENFCGSDTLRVSTRNGNGINAMEVPIFVEPINDLPYIHVPEIIVLKGNGDESLIFNREIDKFDFSIGDPDVSAFPGNESNFMVAFALEVSEGTLTTNLPAELINTTELKHKNSHRWRPLQTYVTISEHFMVQAKGVRFRGTVNHCNSIMQELLYQGEHGAVLTVTLNDMGNYGCYPDCADRMSVPLYAEATVSLIRKQPMSSFLAHALGSAIAIEFIFVLTLGLLLVFFTCKCAILLINERKNEDAGIPRIPQNTQEKAISSAAIIPETTDLAGFASSPLLVGRHPSNFRQRSRHAFKDEESNKAAYRSSFSSSDHIEHSPPTLKSLTISKEQSERA